MSKAVELSNTFRYIDDLSSVNNDNLGKSICEIYPLELELKDTTLSSKEVCFLDTKISRGVSSTPFHIDVYDQREDFNFRIVNFPFMDSNIHANPAYGVYISQCVLGFVQPRWSLCADSVAYPPAINNKARIRSAVRD